MGDEASDAEVDFTPLIDVTFLLLIFFMVTTNLSQPTDVKLPRAESGRGETVRDKLLVHIAAGDDAQARVRLGGDEAAAVPLAQLKSSLASYPGLQSAMIRADEDVPFAYVDRVAARLRALGVPRVLLGVKQREFIKRP